MSVSAFRRVVRRETHSPRTVAMIIAVAMTLLALLYFAVEVVLALVGQPALLITPGAAFQWLVGLPNARPSGLVIGGGVALSLLGLLFTFLALAPGRLAKHRMEHGERAVVIDNRVIAAAVAQHVCDETGLARNEVTVGVGHRIADVTLRPAVGVPVQKDEVTRIVAAELNGYRLWPSVRPRVRIVRARDSEDDP